MKLPENIHKLLSSLDHRDRAIGILLLEQLPGYEQLFGEIDKDVSDSCTLKLNDTCHRPCTIVKGKTTYWINTGKVYKWEPNEERCTWSGAEETITI